MTSRWFMVSLSVALLSLTMPRVALAQASTGPAASSSTVTANHGDPSVDLKGVPPEVAKLIISFNTVRDKFLLKQHLLQESLLNATTDDQRQAIRDQLQANRQAFLDELADFRTQIKDELKSVQGRISSAEVSRIIDAATSTGGDHRHRGH